MQVTSDIAGQKKAFRTQCKSIRQNFTATQKDNYDNKIFYSVINLPLYLSCKKILLYISNAIEVDTLKIFDNAIRNGKTVLVPKCIVATRQMEFYAVNNMSDLVSGAYNILEPDTSKCRVDNNLDDTICFVPALAFDKLGYRLGFGMGYYDRFLSVFTGQKIGLCYSDCIYDELPCNQFDTKVDVLITENNIKYFN